MKNFALITLLSLTLAACSQGQTPNARTGTPPTGSLGTGPTYPTTQAAYDALALADLDGVAALALAPQVHLNVLPVPANPGSVRAYFKSSFPNTDTCSLDWNDGSAVTAIQSPTLTRVDTRDHAYAAYGSYTVNATCKDASGTTVGTQSVTVQGGVKATNLILNFNTPALTGRTYYYSATTSEGGFTFTGPNFGHFSTGYYDSTPGQYYWGPSQGLYTYASGIIPVMRPDDGKPFTLNSVETHSIRNYTDDYVIVGHKADGSTVSKSTSEIVRTPTTVTFDSTWTNLTSVDFGNGSQSWILDDVNISR